MTSKSKPAPLSYKIVVKNTWAKLYAQVVSHQPILLEYDLEEYVC